jgi:hypothetical protein
LLQIIFKLNNKKVKTSKVEQPDREIVPGPKQEPRGVEKQTTSSLSKNAEVNELLSKYSDNEKEFLEVQEAVNQATSGAGEKAKKCLAICDYVTLPECIISDDEETLLTTSGRQLTLKSKTKKIEPKDVTAAQWIGANARILSLLKPGLTKSELSRKLSMRGKH